jgi:molybdate transport system permease protein
MHQDFLATLLLTGKMALYTTVILLLIGLPVAYWLSYCRFKLKFFVEALVCMPMVLPPTVMGYYFLVLVSPNQPLGSFVDQYLDVRLAFSFEGIVLASVVANLPFMIQPLQNGFQSLSDHLRWAAYSMGKSKIHVFFSILLPNIRPSLITGIALTFAHCIGEFGIVLMVGGNIPGETRIASIEIYDKVQALNFDEAKRYSLVLFAISFLMLLLIFSVNRKFRLNSYSS